MVKKGIQVLKARIGLISNEPSLIEKNNFYLMETDFREIKEISFDGNFDAYLYIYDFPDMPAKIIRDGKDIIALGDFSKLHKEAKDLRYSLLGNEGLLYRYILNILEEKHNIYSFHSAVLFNEENEILYIIAGGAGSGKTVFLLNAIEKNLKIFSTEMGHFKIKEGNVIFYKGSLFDNVRIENLKEDFPNASKVLGLDRISIKSNWGKVTLDLRRFQTEFDEIKNPKIFLIFPHVEKERKEIIKKEIKDERDKIKFIFDNISQKPGETILLYEKIPIYGFDTETSLKKRIENVKDFLKYANLKGFFSLVGGIKNCFEIIK